uniref:Uncharacterized protein n=1 Tax=Human herpesvirus 1 TaxID=10298 RepID=A0A2Z4GZU5_HHV1|nr:hypothetical protein [Human alphaherpesvirus 1]AWW10935.1 hypothetical protein [Human alphaherpesvirus 1]
MVMLRSMKVLTVVMSARLSWWEYAYSSKYT